MSTLDVSPIPTLAGLGEVPDPEGEQIRQDTVREIAQTLALWVQQQLSYRGRLPAPPVALTIEEVIEALARLAMLTEEEQAQDEEQPREGAA